MICLYFLSSTTIPDMTQINCNLKSVIHDLIYFLACEKCIVVIYVELQFSSYNVLTSQLTSLEAGHCPRDDLKFAAVGQAVQMFFCGKIMIFLQTRDVYKMVVAFSLYF